MADIICNNNVDFPIPGSHAIRYTHHLVIPWGNTLLSSVLFISIDVGDHCDSSPSCQTAVDDRAPIPTHAPDHHSCKTVPLPPFFLACPTSCCCATKLPNASHVGHLPSLVEDQYQQLVQIYIFLVSRLDVNIQACLLLKNTLHLGNEWRLELLFLFFKWRYIYSEFFFLGNELLK